MKQSRNPRKFFLITAAVFIAVLCGVLLYFTRLSFLIAYIISLNLITFLAYGYDKRQAKNNALRTPEFVLHLLTLFGGSGGALAGQYIFRHKTRKIKFLILFWAIVVFQAIVIYLLREYIEDMMGF